MYGVDAFFRLFVRLYAYASLRVGSVENIASQTQILYNFRVEYPFPPVGIVGAADGKNRRAFLLPSILGSASVWI